MPVSHFLSCAQGITAYQTHYSMAALTVRAAGSPLQPPDGAAFNLPMASLDGREGHICSNCAASISHSPTC